MRNRRARAAEPFVCKKVDSPIGGLVLVGTARQLDEYFAGTRRTFDVKLNFIGTEFQNRVWGALLRIPFGETRSYGQIARELGNSRATRAVGTANGKNPW